MLCVLNIDYLELLLQAETYKLCGKKTKQKLLEYLNVPYKCILKFVFGFRTFNSPVKAAFRLQNCPANTFHGHGKYAREVTQV